MKHIELIGELSRAINGAHEADLLSKHPSELLEQLFFTNANIKYIRRLGEPSGTREKTIELVQSLSTYNGTVEDLIQETYNKELNKDTAIGVICMLRVLDSQNLF